MNPLDGVLLKNIAAHHGLDLAQRYQRLPLFLVPGDLSVLAQQEMELLETIGDGDDALLLPYPDMLLDFPAGSMSFLRSIFGEWPLDRGRLWVRVRLVSYALARGEKDILDLSHLRTLTRVIEEGVTHHMPPVEQWVLLEAWEEKTVTGAFPSLPDFILSPLTSAARDFGCLLHAYPNRHHLEGRLAGLWCNLKHCPFRELDPRRLPCHSSDKIMAGLPRHDLI